MYLKSTENNGHSTDVSKSGAGDGEIGYSLLR